MLPGIGVFGTGGIVRTLIPFLRDKGFCIEAIWGRTSAEAQQAAHELAIPFHTSRVDDVLLRKDVDLVFIVCSPNLHAQIAVKALGIGKHVVCDKPAGLSQSEALKMVKAAQYYPSLISLVNHSLRFLPAFAGMKRQIEEGYIGGSVSLVDVRVQMGGLSRDKYDWHCDETMGGGILALVGSHIIDLITYLTQQRAVRVHAVVRTFTQTTRQIAGIRRVTSPDFCSFQMELSGGALVTATLSDQPRRAALQEVVVCGPGGHLVARGGRLSGCRAGRQPNNDEEVELEREAEEEAEEEEELHAEAADVEVYPAVDFIPRPCIEGLRKMIDALREAFQPVEDKRGWVKEPVLQAATFEDGLYVQAVIDALKRSNRSREWTRVSVMLEEPDPNPLFSAAVRATAISI